MTRKKLYLLDVSGFIFRAYYALPTMRNPQGESTQALFGFIRSVLKLFKEFGPEHVVAVFDGPDNKKQRQDLYEKYKSNRTKAADDLPPQIVWSRDFCDRLGIHSIEIPGVEADDTIGTLAKWASENGYDVFLCTSDKDLCQLVNEHVFVMHPWKDYLLIDRQKVEEIYGVPPERIVDLLAIMGDSSDNIPGLTGFGPKTAVALLKEFGSLENLLQNPEKVSGQKKQETLIAEADLARLSYRLATIHTDVEFPKSQELFTLHRPDLSALKSFYLEMGFHSLIREMEAITGELAPLGAEPKAENLHYHLVNDEKSFLELLELLQKEKEICFDVESTHLRPLLAKIVGVGFCIKAQEAYYVPFNGNLNRSFILKELKKLFESDKHAFFGHNVKYDCHVLANEGIKVANICFDTILASYILNSESRRHSLDQLALQYFAKVKTPIKELIGTGKNEISMSEVPLTKITDYCCEDVDYTFRLKTILAKQIIERKLTKLLYDLELPLSRVLEDMEREGIYVDVEQLSILSHRMTHELEGVREKIYGMAGEEFNISSPKQLSQILFEKLKIKPLKKTATGLSTRAEVLEVLAADYPIAEQIISYRTLEKLLTTYVDTLSLEVNPVTHRVHPTFNQSVAATGRLSCQDPNLQNIPARTPQGRMIRAAFKPQKTGWSYVAADYSQIELRLLAHLSQDPRLIKAFQQGEDIHTYTASLVFNTPLEHVSSTQRHQAKAINFGIIYGQQAFGLSQELRIDVKEAAAFIEAYFERYPQVLLFIQECIEKARKEGKAVTMIGREREIPEIRSPNGNLRTAAERLAINTPLQGSAADLIKIAMLDIDAQLKKKKFQSYMILQIHDELIFEAPDEEVEFLSLLVKKAMESVFSLDVPLLVDVKVGKNWEEC